MKIFKIYLLLLIPMVSCVNSKGNESVPSTSTEESKLEKDTVHFNTHITGSGSPTVIFESGLGTPLNNWHQVQTSISANYKTISYDRLGIGGSSATESPRNIDNLVSDLRTLITLNEIDGPIVFVGHSLGGHIARKYQELYPSNVVGLFLIDPTNEYLYDAVFNEMTSETVDSMKTAWDDNFKNQPIGVYNEWKEVDGIDAVLRKCPLPTGIPITILASYQESSFLTETNAKLKKELLSDWQEGKANVTILETTNSGHYIHLGEPDWVISQLETFLMNIQ
ncbi:alpha/beta fold hydrolase [Phaeocystidibacter marisrubri]|uniref:Alpha/beta hydrolase n=1 Tax=Phaeocystidibacter marisrubri TaxID=1577780 RepID=A0A6L3ZIG1_9FLAO|nr:alpha/beta hydrolase [Phaeocystidibacter marisrubri]KAB2817674.1 alpha/beta hydrolase [Phaeocystidibacter marisrubri]GGH74161.1 alpha/beta hydrolase [Phaeocystidibacter marisrubri]